MDHLQKDLKFIAPEQAEQTLLEHNSHLGNAEFPLIALSRYSSICDTEKKNAFYPGCQIKEAITFLAGSVVTMSNHTRGWGGGGNKMRGDAAACRWQAAPAEHRALPRTGVRNPARPDYSGKKGKCFEITELISPPCLTCLNLEKLD